MRADQRCSPSYRQSLSESLRVGCAVKSSLPRMVESTFGSHFVKVVNGPILACQHLPAKGRVCHRWQGEVSFHYRQGIRELHLLRSSCSPSSFRIMGRPGLSIIVMSLRLFYRPNSAVEVPTSSEFPRLGATALSRQPPGVGAPPVVLDRQKSWDFLKKEKPRKVEGLARNF